MKINKKIPFITIRFWKLVIWVGRGSSTSKCDWILILILALGQTRMTVTERTLCRWTTLCHALGMYTCILHNIQVHTCIPHFIGSWPRWEPNKKTLQLSHFRFLWKPCGSKAMECENELSIVSYGVSLRKMGQCLLVLEWEACFHVFVCLYSSYLFVSDCKDDRVKVIWWKLVVPSSTQDMEDHSYNPDIK